MRLLAQARVSFGVALGHLLPEERMATAARWTGRALRTAWGLGDPGLLAAVLRMHGNELRKAGHPAAAIIRLRQSLELETDPARTGSGLVLLARAAGPGQAGLFDAATTECRRLLPAGAEVLFSTFTVRETRLRGLLATGRARQAVDLAETIPAGDEPPTPQWRVIERITTACVLAAAGEEHDAARMLTDGSRASRNAPPAPPGPAHHRITAQPGVLPGAESLRAQAADALSRLRQQLSEASPA